MKENRIKYLNFSLKNKVLIKRFYRNGFLLDIPKDRIIEEMLNIKQ